ncbi:MAG: GntR family transcriptional regulator, partial [Victivallaceae bacterium]
MNRQPIYKQICEHLLGRIEAGELRCGDLLPSENDLTRQFEVSRMTVRAALAELEKSGVVRCTHGKGREVCANHRSRSSDSVKPVAVFPFFPTVAADDINYHNGILNGMGDSLLRYGLPVRYVSPGELKNRDRDFLTFFTPERYSGLIWINSNQPWVFDTVRLLPLLKIPYVMLNYILPPQMGCYAATDHFGGMEKITRHLLAKGIRKIALLSADIRAYGYAQLRWEGFRRT